MAALVVIQQATWSGDDDIGGDGERGFLVGNGMSAIARSDLVIHGQHAQYLGRLHHQFPRGRHNYRLQALHGRFECLQQAQSKGQRLSRSRWRIQHEVSPTRFPGIEGGLLHLVEFVNPQTLFYQFYNLSFFHQSAKLSKKC